MEIRLKAFFLIQGWFRGFLMISIRNEGPVSIPGYKVWDAERNTNEFISSMEEWKNHGLLAFTLNLQGGSPSGYGNQRGWINSAFDEMGNLRDDYLKRLERILDNADKLGWWSY